MALNLEEEGGETQTSFHRKNDSNVLIFSPKENHYVMVIGNSLTYQIF